MNNLEEFYATRKAMAKFFSEEELKQKEAELIQNEILVSRKLWKSF